MVGNETFLKTKNEKLIRRKRNQKFGQNKKRCKIPRTLFNLTCTYYPAINLG